MKFKTKFFIQQFDGLQLVAWHNGEPSNRKIWIDEDGLAYITDQKAQVLFRRLHPFTARNILYLMALGAEEDWENLNCRGDIAFQGEVIS